MSSGSAFPSLPPSAFQYCHSTSITWLESSGNSAFASMQTTFEKRFSHGISLLSTWTWSHGLENVGGDGGANRPVPQDPRNRRGNWASSNCDARHRFNMAGTYLLPFGPGQKFSNGGGPLRRVLGDWVLGRLAMRQSGLPFTVTVPGSPANTGHGSRANPIAGVSPIPANQSISLWCDPAAFTWGTLGRNTLKAPARMNLDFSMAKKRQCKETKERQFRS